MERACHFNAFKLSISHEGKMMRRSIIGLVLSCVKFDGYCDRNKLIVHVCMFRRGEGIIGISDSKVVMPLPLSDRLLSN